MYGGTRSPGELQVKFASQSLDGFNNNFTLNEFQFDVITSQKQIFFSSLSLSLCKTNLKTNWSLKSWIRIARHGSAHIHRSNTGAVWEELPSNVFPPPYERPEDAEIRIIEAKELHKGVG